MVWHTFMLSPRKFFSDCIRHNKIGLWRCGLPLSTIAQCIDHGSFAYNPSPGAMSHFTELTGLAWDSRETTSVSITCHHCAATLTAPLTTCNKPEHWRSAAEAGQGGQGYAEASFSVTCTCERKIDHDRLRVWRFEDDLEALLWHGKPLPTTTVTLDGLPAQASIRAASMEKNGFVATFPHRLIFSGLVPQIAKKNDAGHFQGNVCTSGIVTVAELKTACNEAFREGLALARMGATRWAYPSYAETQTVKRMLQSYWANDSIFCMDLVGAVVRQSSFVRKMHAIDWLHSPSLLTTVDRLIAKYLRFIGIMRANPGKTAVPTLDVDLAWHTHQLCPESYHAFSIANTGKLINHDDAISENTLSSCFEWTSKTYEKMYNRVYAECTCWYCETIREAYSPSSWKPGFLRSARLKSELRELHAKSQDPGTTAHISSHNAIKIDTDQESWSIWVRDTQLNPNYAKVRQRAKKEGRQPPEQHTSRVVSSWGYEIKVEFHGPWSSEQCGDSSLYPTDPAYTDSRTGAEGNCCSMNSGGGDDADGGDGGDAGDAGCSSCGNCGGGDD